MTWRWLRRPKWLIAVVILLALVAWVLWPLKIYRGRYPFYVAVSRSESRHFLGTVSPRFFENPWEADREFDARRGGLDREVEGIGHEAMWVPGTFFFRTSNIDWTIAPAEKFKGFKRGEPEWEAEIEALARRTVEEIEAGRLERARASFVPRGILWLRASYPVAREKVESWFENP